MIVNSYGIQSAVPMSSRDVEWNAFRLDAKPPIGLGKTKHFWRAAALSWPELVVKDKNGKLHESDRVNPWLKRCIKAFTSEEYAVRRGNSVFRTIVLTGCGGAGKAQPLGALVYTPSGPKMMGDIRVGDKVCTPDGGVAPVIGVYPQGERDIYRVTMADGSFTWCCKEHLWEITDKYPHQRKVVDTEFLLKNHRRYSDRRMELGIEFTKPVAFDARPLKIHPYLMGVLLGDGTLGGAWGRQCLGFSSVDPEIIERVRLQIGEDYKLNKSFRACDYRIVKKKKGCSQLGNVFIDALTSYGLWASLSDSKFIPDDYLFNSVENRLEIVRGLLDTDGTVERRKGNAVFYSTSRRLAYGMNTLIQSLGGTCSVSVKKPFHTYKGVRKPGKDCFVVNIKYHTPSDLFSLSRKKALTKKRRINGYQRLISGVDPFGREQVQCILIDHPRHLYLTDGFIPTHNTQAAGFYAVGWWGCSPHNSIAILTSTTKEMIRHRMWPVIQHYSQSLADTQTGERLELGHMIDSMTTLQSKKGDFKRSIFALAVASGETQRALHNLKGQHAPRMLVVIDEANGTPEAILEAIPNLRKACQDFTLIIIGNPTTRLDPHGRAMEPIDGWKSVGVDSVEWRTKAIPEWQVEAGVCVRFDGKDSPNVKAGKNIYPYLYNIENWEAAKQHEGTFAYWSQDRGIHPPDGMSNTVFNEQLIERCEAVDYFTFLGLTIEVAFLDPAFGGDACVIQFGKLGDIGGKMGLQLTDWLEIPISPEAESHDVDYQIARRVIEECRSRNIKPNCFGIDATGIGRGVGAIIAAEWSPFIHYTAWGGTPSDRPSAQNDGRPALEVYTTFVGELWFGAREGMEARQVKGFSRQAIMEFCAREYDMQGKKFKLEIKDEMRKRMRFSPDHADAVVGAVEVARRNGLVIEGKVGSVIVQENVKAQRQAQEALGLPDEKTENDGGWSGQDVRGERENFDVIQWQ